MKLREYWHEHGWRTLTLIGAIVLLAIILVKIVLAHLSTT